MELSDYLNLLKDLEKLFDIAYNFTSLLKGKCKNQRKNIASAAFLKIVLNVGSILKILPKSKYSSLNLIIWDIFSIASLTRNLIESSNVLFYFSIEKIDNNEIDFRDKLYKFHSLSELRSIVKSMG